MTPFCNVFMERSS